MKSAAPVLLVLLVAACAAPPGRTLMPEGDPFAGLAPPPLPTPATFPYTGPFGPVERGDPPVVIVPAPPVTTTFGSGEIPELEGGSVYGTDAPYGADFGAGRRRFQRR